MELEDAETLRAENTRLRLEIQRLELVGDALADLLIACWKQIDNLEPRAEG